MPSWLQTALAVSIIILCVCAIPAVGTQRFSMRMSRVPEYPIGPEDGAGELTTTARVSRERHSSRLFVSAP